MYFMKNATTYKHYFALYVCKILGLSSKLLYNEG